MTNLPPPQNPDEYGRHAFTPPNELEELRRQVEALKTELAGERQNITYLRGQLGEVAHSITGVAVDVIRRDQKTQLLNTVGFERAVEAAKQTASPKVVLFADLEGFGGVNNNLGHNRGDDVLVAVANTLNNSLRTGNKEPKDTQAKHAREHDVLCRPGGDEFVAIAHIKDDPNYSKEQQVAAMTGRMRKNLDELLAREEFSDVRAVGLGVYLGVTDFDPNASAAEMQRRANEKMLEEKMAKKAARAKEAAEKTIEMESPTPSAQPTREAIEEMLRLKRADERGRSPEAGGGEPRTLHLGVQKDFGSR